MSYKATLYTLYPKILPYIFPAVQFSTLQRDGINFPSPNLKNFIPASFRHACLTPIPFYNVQDVYETVVWLQHKLKRGHYEIRRSGRN
jgi:hypothetical protein